MDGRLTLVVLLLVSLLCGAAVWVQMREADPERGALLFKTAFTQDRVQELLAHPPLNDDKGREQVRQGLAWDYVFIPLYAFFLWAAIKLTTGPYTKTPVPFARWVTAVPIAAAALDAIENRGVLALLGGSRAGWLPPIVAGVAILTLVLVFGTVLYMLAARLYARITGREPLPAPEPPADFEEVLAAEHAALDLAGRGNRAIGLALSGGGIRSATFNLGILQALARLQLLERLDYLSSVSGGGYIGTWLSQWVRRKADDGSGPSPIEQVARELAADPHQQKPEPDPVVHLRNYSNYLTPRIGVLSADTWTTVATYGRNFVLNLVIIVALTGVVLLLPRAVVDWLRFLKDDVFYETPLQYLKIVEAGGVDQIWAALAGASLLGLAVLGTGISLAGAVTREADPEDGLTSQGSVQRLVILPLVVSSIFGGYWLARIDTTGSALLWVPLTTVLYAASWAISTAVAVLVSNERKLAPFLKLGFRMTAWAVPVGIVAGFALMAVNRLVARQLDGPPLHGPAGYLWSDWQVVAFCPPILMTVFTLTIVLHIGLAGRSLDDYLREWLARAGAWITIYSLGWLAFTGLAFYGPVVVAQLAPWAKGIIASGWLGTSIAGALAGNAQQQGSSSKWHPIVAKFAPWVFIVGLVVSVSWGFDYLLSRHQPEVWKSFTAAAAREDAGETVRYDRKDLSVSVTRGVTGASAPATRGLADRHHELLDGQLHEGDFWWWILALAAVACAFSARVAINEFSMHQYYRNRLVRAYLGASNSKRMTNPFTGFDPDDDGPLGLADPPRPFHLINATLNLVHGKRLGWQERKAASFGFSPLHSGYELAADEQEERPQGAYRESSTAFGLTLGTAMAISGAAASPNMGFRSTPALTLLLTVFNVRLGWWLGNTRYKRAWESGGPVFALRPLVAELFGLTSEDSRDIYLSDGGHFENLGVYELVRRRCRFIIASDAGADPELAFTDLANAIRKCRTDFGVEIDIDVGAIGETKDGHSRRHCAVGRITYPRQAKHGQPGDLPERGWLLYIKASITGDEPEDVMHYAVADPAFPHQSTADQFFDESQFESYRRLGLHIGHQVLGARRAGSEPNWEALFKKLYQRWYTPTVPTERSFAQHGRTLASLFGDLGSKPELAFLAPQIYKEWDGLGNPEQGDLANGVPTTPAQRRAGFFFCNSLVQLMENVYLELRLDQEHASPDNRGWMQLFRRWAGTPMLRATWALSAGTYGSRFQSFCERHLGLEQGAVSVGEPADAETIERLSAPLKEDVKRELSERAERGEEIEWRELRLDAPGMGFPVGCCVLSREAKPGRAPVAYVCYLHVDKDLRRSGLAERGLRTLHAELQDRDTRLKISSKHRLAAVGERRWLAFQHFFAGSVDS